MLASALRVATVSYTGQESDAGPTSEEGECDDPTDPETGRLPGQDQ